MKHDDYMKKFENDPEYLKGVIDMLEKDNLRLQKAVDKARPFAEKIISSNPTNWGITSLWQEAEEWLAANPKEEK